MKQPIRIHFTDYWIPFSLQKNIYIDILQKKYDVQLDSLNPDFLFCSCFGHKHASYSCVKICCLGENVTPDFNIYDYAYGFDRMTFADRYLRYPLYKLYIQREDMQEKSPSFWSDEITNKAAFCNFLYSNNRNASPTREAFFHLLSQYKKVDSGGGFLNNIGQRVEDKYAWQRKYKFSIAFENSSKEGYVTEKIYEALRAHTIPIYWGDPTVAQDFNPKRFVNCHDYSSFDDVVDVVRQLDTDETMYRDMLRQPWFLGEKPKPALEDDEFQQFFYKIISQGPIRAHRITCNGFTNQYLLSVRLLNSALPAAKLVLKICNLLKKIQNVFK